MMITELAAIIRRRRAASMRRSRAAFPAFVPADQAAMDNANTTARMNHRPNVLSDESFPALRRPTHCRRT